MKVIGNLTKDAIIRAAVSEGLTVTQVIGSEVVFEAANSDYQAVAFDSNSNKVVIAYTDRDASFAGTAIVGTVSGTSISFGTPVVFNASDSRFMAATFDSNSNKVVIAYEDNGNSSYGTAIVGTVSGTSISFGTPVVYESAESEYNYATFDSNSNKVVISYQDKGNSSYGTSIVGTVSGTSISFGSPVVFESAETSRLSSTFDSNLNKVVISYRDQGNSNYGAAIVGTVSGTSISFGSAAVFESAAVNYTSIAYDANAQKVVIAYEDDANSDYGTAIVGTVSGTSISFGSAVVFEAAQVSYIGIVYDATAQKVVIAYRDQGNSNYGTLIAGTVSGTSISFGSAAVFNTGDTYNSFLVYDSNSDKVVIAYSDWGNSGHGTAVVFQTGYTSDTGGTIADGSTVIVNANGTVSSISETPVSESVGTPSNITGSQLTRPAVAYDANAQKVVIAYRDNGNSNQGYAVVGTVSGTSISFGTPVQFESGYTDQVDITYDSTAQKVVIAYQDIDNSSYGTAVVGTVSGTSISFGTPVVFKSAALQSPTRIAYHSAKNRVGIIYKNSSATDNGEIVIGEVSGTSLTFGSSVTFESGLFNDGDIVYDASAERFVTAHKDENTSNNGFCCVISVGGTGDLVPTVNTRQSFNGSSSASKITAVYDSSNQKVVIAFADGASSAAGTAIVATIGSTSATFGTKVQFTSNNISDATTGIAYDSGAGKVVISYRDRANSDGGYIVSGAVSGTSISFDTPVVFDTNTVAQIHNAYDANAEKVVTVFYDSTSVVGQAFVFQTGYNSTNLTSENFVGFMKGAALDGTNGEILSSCSIARNQTSLTAGQTYFVTPDGSLSTSAGSPSVTAGTAISSTELIVKG